MRVAIWLFGLAVSAAPAERIPGLQRALLQVGKGHPRGVLPRLEAMLVEHPDHARLHAVAGIAYADVGLGPQAVALLETADSKTLPIKQSVALPDAYRDAGQPERAAALRWQSLVSGDRQSRLVWTAARGAVDCLDAGDLDCAARFVSMGWAISPEVWALNALEAEIALQSGDLEAAEIALVVAERSSGRSAHRAVARTKLLISLGEFEEAALFATAAALELSHDVRLVAVTAEAWRRAGLPDQALATCRSKRFNWKGEVVHPALRREEVLALLALGEREEAELRAADLMAELPDHQAAAEVAAALGYRWR